MPTEFTDSTDVKKGMHLTKGDRTYSIIGAAIEVHRDKGAGFVEAVYQECLELEFALQGIPFLAQNPLALTYKGHCLRQTFKPDFICFGDVLVEIKAVSAIVDEHRSQVINYLHATGLKVALLINFGNYRKVEFERIVL